uniref:TMEM9 n=1 Tax=Steinernema glaseri TaxID=37863 RepID=A0A1I7Y4D9_9BILA
MRCPFVLLVLTVAVVVSSKQKVTTEVPTTTREIPIKVWKIEEQHECQESCHDPCQRIIGPHPAWICSNIREEAAVKSIFRPQTLTERVVLLTFIVFLLLCVVLFCGVALFAITCWTHVTVSRRPGIRHSRRYDVEKSMRL